MSETTRVFIAVEIPEPRRDDLVRLRDTLAPWIGTGKWIDRAQYHVTLAFLGDVENAQIDGIRQAVDDAAKGHEPLTLRLRGLGAFPEASRPRTLWAGMEGEGLGVLEQLQKSVHAGLLQAGYQPDTLLRFVPHVTLARFNTGRGRSSPPDLRSVLRRHEEWATEPFTVGEVVTLASELRPEGPLYTALARSPLHGG